MEVADEDDMGSVTRSAPDARQPGVKRGGRMNAPFKQNNWKRGRVVSTSINSKDRGSPAFEDDSTTDEESDDDARVKKRRGSTILACELPWYLKRRDVVSRWRAYKQSTYLWLSAEKAVPKGKDKKKKGKKSPSSKKLSTIRTARANLLSISSR